MDTAVKVSDELMEELSKIGAAGSNSRLFERRNRYLSVPFDTSPNGLFRNALKAWGMTPPWMQERDGSFEGSPCWIVPKNIAHTIRRRMAIEMGMQPALVHYEAREYDPDEAEMLSRGYWVRTRCGDQSCIRPGHLIMTRGRESIKPEDRVPVEPFELPEGLSPADLDDLDMLGWLKWHRITFGH